MPRRLIFAGAVGLDGAGRFADKPRLCRRRRRRRMNGRTVVSFFDASFGARPGVLGRVGGLVVFGDVGRRVLGQRVQGEDAGRLGGFWRAEEPPSCTRLWSSSSSSSSSSSEGRSSPLLRDEEFFAHFDIGNDEPGQNRPVDVVEFPLDVGLDAAASFVEVVRPRREHLVGRPEHDCRVATDRDVRIRALEAEVPDGLELTDNGGGIVDLGPGLEVDGGNGSESVGDLARGRDEPTESTSARLDSAP